MRWSIRTKILILLSSLLLIVVMAYLLLAEKILREDKELLLLDTSRSTTERLANELDSSLRRIVDKIELLAGLPQATERLVAERFFEKDPDLLVFQLLSPTQKDKPVLIELISRRKLQEAHLQLDQVRDRNILPTTIPTQNTLVVENRSIPNTALYLIRVPLNLLGIRTELPLYAQVLTNGKSWEGSFEDSQTFALSFAVTSNGEVFAHPDPSFVFSRRNLNSLKGVSRKTAIGSLTVVSMANKGATRLASKLLFEKTMVLSLIIVTTVLLISVFFSSSLIKPLRSLVKATRQIAQGDFDTQIEIQTGDEIGDLSSAFSQMVKELKSSRVLLEEYNRDLERKVHERTQELEDKNAAIRQHQEVMLKSTRLAAVGEIAGQAAHEVLNPLTAMISSLENLIYKLNEVRLKPSAPIPIFKAILKAWNESTRLGGVEAWLRDLKRPSQILPGKSLAEEDIQNLTTILEHLDKFSLKMKTDLGIILSESHRIGRIVDRMRGLSRTSRMPSQLEMNSLISDCIRVIEDLLARYRIKIETQFETTSLCISADKDEMWQVFSNLIKNSMDAIQERRKQAKNEDDPKEGMIRITIQATELEILISFWDNGIGISPMNWDRIFETNFSTKGADGTGFGLGICRRFVRECGGEIILFKSEPGQYTEFKLTFPRIQMNQKDEHVTG